MNLINPFGRHFCRPCDRRHIVAQMAGDEVSLTLWHSAKHETEGWAEKGRRNGIENQS